MKYKVILTIERKTGGMNIEMRFLMLENEEKDFFVNFGKKN
jgi:hypothetical protein